MKIALIGASGMIGSRILQEALDRGHWVTAIVRHPEKIETQHEHLTVAKGDALNEAELSALLRGHDAVVSAFGIDWARPETYPNFSKAATTIINSAKQAGVRRVISVGGAGSLELAPGKQLVDTPTFPAAYKAASSAQRDSLNVYRAEQELEWTFFSPAIQIAPGERTGKFRLGKDNPIFDANGQSHISAEDFAIALVDELEQPKHVRQRFTIGY